MPQRSASSRRVPAGRRPPFTVDVAAFSPRARALGVLCQGVKGRSRERWALPSGVPRSGETLERCARRLVREVAGAEPAWMEQVLAVAGGKKHATDGGLSIGFVAVMPAGEGTWVGLGEVAALSARQRVIVDAALVALRTRMDHAPIAFRLLSVQFTLSELQQTYEVLLGKRLHKASFRRALQAAYLVEPTDEWRNEGRGRPAQFYEYAPRKRRVARRGVRFDALV